MLHAVNVAQVRGGGGGRTHGEQDSGGRAGEEGHRGAKVGEGDGGCTLTMLRPLCMSSVRLLTEDPLPCTPTPALEKALQLCARLLLASATYTHTTVCHASAVLPRIADQLRPRCARF